MVRTVSPRLPYLLGFLIAVGPVSTDMYLPAFPAIARDLHNTAAPQYSLAAYFAGLALGQMTQGPVSDRFGRRRPLLAGLIVYTLASIGCWMSWNVESLVAFRFVAALGASASTLIPRAMVRDLADGPKAAKLFSQLMLVMGVAPICSPMLGAGIVEMFSWRVIFAACTLYGVVALALAWLKLPDTLPPERRIELGAGTVLIRYGEIIRERAFLTHAGIGAFTAGCLFSYLAATPQIFINLYHWSTADYAILFGVNSVAYIGYNQINPGMVNRFGLARVISFGVGVQAVCGLGLAILALHPLGALPIEAILLACEVAFGLLTPCALVGAMSRHQAHAGSASALFGTLQYTGGALAGLSVGALADGTARPMGFAMLGCALVALLAAAKRPRLSFGAAE